MLLTLDPLLYAETLSLSEEEARNYLIDIEEKWTGAQVPLGCDVKTGPVAESIINYAQENKINLIVMSSHGRSGISRWVYGSVAEKVLRQACCASLIIRSNGSPPPETFQNILVCLDGSALAEQVLPPILTLAKAVAAKITLLRIVPPSHMTIETHAMGQLLGKIEELERDNAAVYLHHTLATLPIEDLNVVSKTLVGPPAESIIDFARENNIDLIAMCSHGRSGLSRWVYGSVAERVLRGATCATFIIRGTVIDPQEV